MAEIIDFPGALDIGALDRDTLRRLLEDTLARIAALEEQEPEDMESEAYQAWSERHERLEDLADDICARLDDL